MRQVGVGQTEHPGSCLPESQSLGEVFLSVCCCGARLWQIFRGEGIAERLGQRAQWNFLLRSSEIAALGQAVFQEDSVVPEIFEWEASVKIKYFKKSHQ